MIYISSYIVLVYLVAIAGALLFSKTLNERVLVVFVASLLPLGGFLVTTSFIKVMETLAR